MPLTNYCICVQVDAKALQRLADEKMAGAIKEAHPWLIAAELLATARQQQADLPLLIATVNETGELHWKYWSVVREIDVNRFRSGTESRIAFAELLPIGELWQSLDAVNLAPAAEQLRREQLESLSPSRHPIEPLHLRHYAIGETPAFVQFYRPPESSAATAESE